MTNNFLYSIEQGLDKKQISHEEYLKLIAGFNFSKVAGLSPEAALERNSMVMQQYLIEMKTTKSQE